MGMRYQGSLKCKEVNRTWTIVSYTLSSSSFFFFVSTIDQSTLKFKNGENKDKFYRGAIRLNHICYRQVCCFKRIKVGK